MLAKRLFSSRGKKENLEGKFCIALIVSVTDPVRPGAIVSTKLEPPGGFAEVDTLSFGPLFTEVRGLASTSLLHEKPSLGNCYQPYATREGSLIQPTLPGRRR
jgi:hypothetical protein